MDHQNIIWIKQEETNDISCSPDSMLLQDPLKIEEPCFDIKADPDVKMNVALFEHCTEVIKEFTIPEYDPLRIKKEECLEEPLAASEFTDSIKEDPELHLTEETENYTEVNEESTIPEYDPLRIKKEETEVNEESTVPEYDPLRIKKEETEVNEESTIPEHDPLRIKKEEIEEYKEFSIPEYDGLRIKKEEEVTSIRSLSENAWLTEIHCVTGNTAFEETCLLGVTGDELDIAAENTMHRIRSTTPRQKLLSQEVTALCTRYNDNLEKNELTCNSCKQTFSSKYSLIMHVFIHIDSVQPPAHICKWCGAVFTSHDSLIKHSPMQTLVNREKCSQRTTVSTELVRPRNCPVVCTSKRPLKCDIFNNSFISADSLGEKFYKCSVCGKSFTTSGFLKRHALIHTGVKPHTCTICGKSFTHSGNLKTHSVVHTGEKSHKCSVCEKSFSRAVALKRHELIHTGERPYKCRICEKSFTSSTYLKLHALFHAGIKPHQCDVCGKSFTQSCDLTKHSLIHIGKRKHRCYVCGKPFTFSDHLKKHVLIHTNERPHKCGVCGKSFTDSVTLNEHALKHTGERSHKYVFGISFNCYGRLKKRPVIHTGHKPNTCSVCGKSFSDPGCLKEHSSIHTGERAYKCAVCGKSFTQSLRLKVHALIHSAERCHKCAVCGKSFTQSGDLKEHALIHTGENTNK